MENQELNLTRNCTQENSEIRKEAHMSVPTLELRAKIRDYTKLYRDKIRASTYDSVRFGPGEIKEQIQQLHKLTEKDVIGLASRIKRHKHATNDDMYRLSHAFLMDEKNIEIFCRITGAMQVLVKELTGNDSERRLSSAECLCNLSLGQAHVCEKISSLAGSYLITYLHSAENHLIRICLWTIANILATGLKGAQTLMKMQLFHKLWNFYIQDSVAEEDADFREDAAVCLQIIAFNSKLLEKNDCKFILQHFDRKNPTCSAAEYHLQIVFYIVFSEPEFVSCLSPNQQLYLINFSLSNICNTEEFKTTKDRLRIIYSIRILANLISCHSHCYSMLLQQINLSRHTSLLNILNTLFAFKDYHLTQELMWFVNNILQLEESDGPSISHSSFLEKLKIPKPEFFSFEYSKQSITV